MIWKKLINDLAFGHAELVFSVNFLNTEHAGWNFQHKTFWSIFVSFAQKKVFWHFMQIVSYGANLHEMSKPIFWEN